MALHCFADSVTLGCLIGITRNVTAKHFIIFSVTHFQESHTSSCDKLIPHPSLLFDVIVQVVKNNKVRGYLFRKFRPPSEKFIALYKWSLLRYRGCFCHTGIRNKPNRKFLYANTSAICNNFLIDTGWPTIP